MGFLDDLMKNKKLDKHTMSILQLINSQLSLLLCLINDILDLKMIEAGKYEPRIELFAPASVLDYIKAMFHA